MTAEATAPDASAAALGPLDTRAVLLDPDGYRLGIWGPLSA